MEPAAESDEDGGDDEESEFVLSDGDQEVEINEDEARQEMKNHQLLYGTGEGDLGRLLELPEDTDEILAIAKARSDRTNLMRAFEGKLYNNLLRARTLSLEHARAVMNGAPLVVAGEMHNLYMTSAIKGSRTRALSTIVDYSSERFQTEDHAIDELVALCIIQWIPFEEFASGPDKWTTLPINSKSLNSSAFIKAWNNSAGFSRVTSEMPNSFRNRVDRWAAAYYYFLYLSHGSANDTESDFYGMPWTLQANSWFEQLMVSFHALLCY